MTLRAAFYKGTRPGMAGIYNRLVRWWDRSIYSHCEIAFPNGWCASSSYMDHGVRFKVIDFNPEHWDFVDLPAHLEARAFLWFDEHRGQKYDVLGNLHFIVSRVADDKRKWFCSEAIAASLGIPDPWRYTPGTLASTLKAMTAPAARPERVFLRP